MWRATFRRESGALHPTWRRCGLVCGEKRAQYLTWEEQDALPSGGDGGALYPMWGGQSATFHVRVVGHCILHGEIGRDNNDTPGGG